MTNPQSQWHLDSRVPALLDAVRADCPTVSVVLVPSRSCAYGKDEVRTFQSDAVDQLREIASEYGAACLAHGDATGDYSAMRSFNACPSVDTLVAHVIGDILDGESLFDMSDRACDAILPISKAYDASYPALSGEAV